MRKYNPKIKSAVIPYDLFRDYHESISLAIKAAEVEPGQVAVERVMPAIYKCASDLQERLTHARVKRHPWLKGKTDDTWLTIQCVAMVTTVWSQAVARGKSLDRKRDDEGRAGWYRMSQRMEWQLKSAIAIGNEIANQLLSEQGDLDTSVASYELAKEVSTVYAG
jgi:hypothetical protein